MFCDCTSEPGEIEAWDGDRGDAYELSELGAVAVSSELEWRRAGVGAEIGFV
jgi:hypothetical protein